LNLDGAIFNKITFQRHIPYLGVVTYILHTRNNTLIQATKTYPIKILNGHNKIVLLLRLLGSNVALGIISLEFL